MRKILPAEQNNKTHNTKLFVIVESLKTWRHYLEGATHTILVFTDQNNQKIYKNNTSKQQINKVGSKVFALGFQD